MQKLIRAGWERRAWSAVVLLSLFQTLSLTAENIILFIGDGMGFEHVKAARMYQGGPLSFELLPYQAQVTTYSANSAVTDSAAAGTAMATGSKVNNYVVSVATPGDGSELQTALELYKAQGKKVGLITTSYLTDATPATFGAHAADRNSTGDIAADYLQRSKPNILFGGGGNGLTPAGTTSAGYQVAINIAGFGSLSMDTTTTHLSAQFGSTYMPYEYDYRAGGYPYPHLSEMVAKALLELQDDPNGFFLLVEGGMIDQAAHPHELERTIHEVLEFANAVDVALDWADGRSDTLILVAADHETGGLTVTKDNGSGNYPDVSWSSGNHTGVNVPAYAWGPSADRVAGVLDNTDIYRICTGKAFPMTLVPAGSAWKYHALGTDLGTAWRAREFDDNAWPSGPAELGYGDGDEATLLPSSPVRPCYYFRHHFSVAEPSLVTALSLRVLRDDGCVVYLNGQEVARYNMPAGTISYGTWAASAGEFSWDPPQAIPNLLVAGDNVLAVEVHQSGSNSSDVSMNLELACTRGLGIALNTPLAQATGVALPVTLTATGTEPEGEPLSLGFYGRQTPDAGPDFSIVVLPDTQYYTDQINGGTRDIFIAQTQWIVDQRAANNIVYVAHLGDISNNGDINADEWVNASDALYLLEAPVGTELPNGIPYGAAVGNHDQYVLKNDSEPTTLYNQYFGVTRFQNRGYYGGHYGDNNNNHYDLFSASGVDFIVLYFEYRTNSGPAQAVLDWADSLLKTYPTRRGIVVSHMMLEANAAWTAQGQAIYSDLSDNPNLSLMLCGHYSAESKRTDVYAGNSVHTLLADYQGYANGGNGYLRILEFSPANNQIRVKTYSPWVNAYETDANSQFTLPYSMPTGPDFQLLHVAEGVPSGTQASFTWTGLLPGVTYEWLAVAAHGLESRASETRQFTTSGNAPPIVTLTSPVGGTVFNDNPAKVTIAATASDPDGSVASVAFFSGSIPLGSDEAAPYGISADLGGGLHTLTAVATDNLGAQTVSALVQITVGLPRPPLSLTATPTSKTAITLAWVDSASNESGFQVFVSPDNVNYSLFCTTDPDVAQVVVTGLQPATQYFFVVRAYNNFGAGDTPWVEATTPANQVPTAVDQSVTVDEDGTVAVTLTGSDPDGDSLSYTFTASPTHGVLTGTAPYLFYTPAINYNGTDAFAYEISDGSGGTASATVSVTVSPVNDAPAANDDGYTMNQDTVLIVAAPGVLGNDTDPDGDALTAILESGPGNGLILNDDGSFAFTPNTGFTGKVEFTYVVSDGNGGSSAGNLTITVNRMNQAPVAEDDAYAVNEDASLMIAAPGVLSNDTDPGADPLVALLTGGPANGDLQFNENGSFTYTPNRDFNGTDSFAYKASDGLADSEVVTVVITVAPVNDAPVANAQVVSVDEDVSVAITLTGSDADGDTLSYSFGNPAHGTLTGDAPTLTYRPNANFNGVDTFTFTVNDGSGPSVPAMVSITVIPVNDVPVADAQSVAVDEDGTVAVTLTASDVDGDSLIYTVTVFPAHGTLSGTAPNLTYTPDANYSGSDSFSFVASDGSSLSSPAVVSVSITAVNDAPIAGADAYSVDQNQTLTVSAPGVLANDSDVDSSSLTAVQLSGTANGSLTLNEDGSFTYTPNPDFNGTDNFTYAAWDGAAQSIPATVTITVVQPPAEPKVHVASIEMAVVRSGKNYRSTARVTIVNQDDVRVAGATVTGNWTFGSRSLGAPSSVVTDASGVAQFTSAAVKNTSGTFTFAVGNVVFAGASYDSASNVEWFDSITYP